MKIKIKPLAFESLGVRSMCTFIETPDVNITIDPGVSLGKRFGLLPHPREYEALIDARSKVLKHAEKSEILIISHYHFDHYTPLGYTDYTWTWSITGETEEIYIDKVLLVKDYRDNINFSQRKRGWIFNRLVEGLARKIEIADSKTFEIGETRIEFSSPVWHGEANTPLGWVLMILIEHDEDKLIFASDVQGPMESEALNFILKSNPKILIIGGPPTYLPQYKIKTNSIKSAIKNLEIIVKQVPLVILDHHLLRDAEWRKYVEKIFEIANKYENKVITAAEYLAKKNILFESIRRRLYDNEPPNKEFINWTKLPKDKRRVTPPPI
ncbi:MAG TPA: MBL fold metallo-hydrolase [Candidatus Atribacteria bacterium]|nr:MBL fold metallo-hydrolase [Candidatus Atribacteria bacterium]